MAVENPPPGFAGVTAYLAVKDADAAIDWYRRVLDAELLYRIEREVIPALKRNHIVIMDRGTHTLIVRGLMIGMTDTQLRTGLLWWRNTIYRELFDKAITIHITVKQDESIDRIQKRELKAAAKSPKKKKKGEGTLLALHFIDTIVYAPDGKKMTRNDKKVFIHKTQAQIIDTYNIVFADEKRPYIEIDGNLPLGELEKTLKKEIVDMLF